MSRVVRRIAAILIIACAASGLVGCGGGEPVPDVTGLPPSGAELTLQRAGFPVGDIEYDESSEVAWGRVVSQDPAGDDLARPGSEVTIVVAGPQLTRVPFLVGRDESEAVTRISLAGLQRGGVVREHHAVLPPGVVISQDLDAGSQVPRNTKVQTVVSLGPESEQVPGVIGQNVDAARDLVGRLGFRVVVSSRHDRTIEGTVVEQQPDPRTRLALGERIALVVSRGPEMRVIPDLRGLTAAQANEVLEDAGMTASLRTAGGTVVTADDVSTVVVQDPRPGREVPVGLSVVLYVGKQ